MTIKHQSHTTSGWDGEHETLKEMGMDLRKRWLSVCIWAALVIHSPPQPAHSVESRLLSGKSLTLNLAFRLLRYNGK